MRVIIFTLTLLITASAHANKSVPSGVECMVKAKKLGLSIGDSYQACSVNTVIRACILKVQEENQGLAQDKKELASLGKKAIQKCQSI